jgi:hypothetical protein
VNNLIAIRLTENINANTIISILFLNIDFSAEYDYSEKQNRGFDKKTNNKIENLFADIVNLF